MANKRDIKRIQGVDFDVKAIKALGKVKFCSQFKDIAKKKRANPEDWYSQIVGKEDK